jgi:hypothetical protein
MSGYSADNLTYMVEKVTAGATGALGKISMSGYDASKLSGMTEKVTAGATGELGKIKMTGYDKDDLNLYYELLIKITDGSLNSLNNIEMVGYDPKIQSIIISYKVNEKMNSYLNQLREEKNIVYIKNVFSENENTAYYFGDEIIIKVLFSDNVTVTDTYMYNPILFLDVRQFWGIATFKGGNGTDTLEFKYMVEMGDKSLDLDYISIQDINNSNSEATSAFFLSQGRIHDNDGDNVSLILPIQGSIGSLSKNNDIQINPD